MSPSAALWTAYLALAVFLALPMLGVEVPLGVDTLNHLARIHVRAHVGNDPDLARLFEIRPYLVPYMGLDWLVTPLARVMPTLVAGRVAIVLMLWGTVGVVLVLQRAFTGRIGYEPLLVGLVSYNVLLASGFLNYMLGVVGALLGLAAWHAMRGRRWLPRLAAAAAVATGLYFTHLLALALYGVMLGSYEVFGRRWAWRTPVRDWLLLGAQFLPAALLWVQLAMPPPGARTGLAWIIEVKVLALMSPFVFSGAGGGAGLGLATLAGCAVLLIGLTRAGVLRWDRRLAAPAIVLAVMGLVVPTWAGGVYLVDLRFPPVAACLAIAALRFVPGRCPAIKVLPAGLLLAAAALAQGGSVALEMRACDRQYGELRAALQAVPRGAVLTAVKEGAPAPGIPCTGLNAYDFMPLLVTLERSGYNSGFFARATAVDVRGLPSDGEPIAADMLAPGQLPAGGYLLWMHLGHPRPLPPGLTLLHGGSFFDLFSIGAATPALQGAEPSVPHGADPPA